MELEDEPEFDNDFDDEDLDRHAMECLEEHVFLFAAMGGLWTIWLGYRVLYLCTSI